MNKILRSVLLIILFVSAFATSSVAMAADDHIDAQDRTGTLTITKNADGTWSLTSSGVTKKLSAAEAKDFGDRATPDPPPPPPPACSNWADDDNDGFKDFQDAGCTSATDNDESNVINPPPSTRPAVAFWLTQTGNFGSGFANSATRDEAVIAQGFWRTDITDPFKAAGKKAFVYKNLTRLTDPDSGGNHSACLTKAQGNSTGNPFGAQWTSTVSDPDTFVAGVIARPVQPVDYGNFCADKLIAQYNSAASSGHPIDGYFMDDVNVYSCPNQGGLPDSDFNGSTCTAADDTAWENWVTSVDQTLTARLRAAGILVSGNMAAAWGDYSVQSAGNKSWFDTNVPLYDFPFAEMSFTWPDGSNQTQAAVDETIRLVKHVATNNRVAVLNVPSATSAAGHEFAVGVCLVHAPGNCVKSNRMEGNVAESWLAAYDRAKALGQPTGAAVQTSAGVWTRAYGSKTVTVNQNTRTATIP